MTTYASDVLATDDHENPTDPSLSLVRAPSKTPRRPRPSTPTTRRRRQFPPVRVPRRPYARIGCSSGPRIDVGCRPPTR